MHALLLALGEPLLLESALAEWSEGEAVEEKVSEEEPLSDGDALGLADPEGERLVVADAL